MVLTNSLDIPMPKETEVLVRILSTTLNPDYTAFASGELDNFSENLQVLKLKVG